VNRGGEWEKSGRRYRTRTSWPPWERRQQPAQERRAAGRSHPLLGGRGGEWAELPNPERLVHRGWEAASRPVGRVACRSHPFLEGKRSLG
jgi:hypothetical protein